MRIRDQLAIIDLVHGENNRFLCRIKHFCDGPVFPRDSFLTIDDEDDDIRFVEGDFHLGADFVLERGFPYFDAAGIDDAEGLGEPFPGAVKAVAGDAGGILNNRKTFTDHAIEKGAFPDVWGADKRDES